MPTYSYKCDGCDAAFDIQATIAEKDKGLNVTCPSCNSSDVHQVLHSINILSGGRTRGGCDPSSGCCGPCSFET